MAAAVSRTQASLAARLVQSRLRSSASGVKMLSKEEKAAQKVYIKGPGSTGERAPSTTSTAASDAKAGGGGPAASGVSEDVKRTIVALACRPAVTSCPRSTRRRKRSSTKEAFWMAVLNEWELVLKRSFQLWKLLLNGFEISVVNFHTAFSLVLE